MTAIDSRLPLRCLLLALLLSPAMAGAQHPPLTGSMGAPSEAPPAPTAAPAPPLTTAAAPAPAPVPMRRAEFGDSTRALLRLQAEGSQAGAGLPMLGETASRSYQRYLTSFEHPIPEFFEATLPTNKGQGSTP